ncbi:MAG: hypothetical protein RL557_588 [archaeon]
MKDNEFYDIPRFPKQEGIIVFAISMSRIGNAQSAKKCFEYMERFIPKIIFPVVGLNFIYGDTLYLYSDGKANQLKNKYQTLVNSHKFEFKNILEKNPKYIPHSFSFNTWNQTILQSNEFMIFFGELKKIYQKDKILRKLVEEDIKKSNKEIDDNSVNFILEEILLFYLITKGKVRLQNDYIQDKQKWILNCYPGKPLKSEIYLYQKNFFKLKNPDNVYENCFYDLEGKKL